MNLFPTHSPEVVQWSVYVTPSRSGPVPSDDGTRWDCTVPRVWVGRGTDTGPGTVLISRCHLVSVGGDYVGPTVGSTCHCR